MYWCKAYYSCLSSFQESTGSLDKRITTAAGNCQVYVPCKDCLNGTRCLKNALITNRRVLLSHYLIFFSDLDKCLGHASAIVSEGSLWSAEEHL